jgi:hypothetical protein
MGAASSQMALGSDQLVDELSDRVLHVGVMSQESVATGCNRHELGSWDAGGSLKGVPIRRERVVGRWDAQLLKGEAVRSDIGDVAVEHGAVSPRLEWEKQVPHRGDGLRVLR